MPTCRRRPAVALVYNCPTFPNLETYEKSHHDENAPTGTKTITGHVKSSPKKSQPPSLSSRGNGRSRVREPLRDCCIKRHVPQAQRRDVLSRKRNPQDQTGHTGATKRLTSVDTPTVPLLQVQAEACQRRVLSFEEAGAHHSLEQLSEGFKSSTMLG